MIETKGQKISPHIWQLGDQLYRLDVSLWSHRRIREIFRGTLRQAQARVDEILVELRAKKVHASDGSLTFRIFRDVLVYYYERHYRHTARGRKSKYVYEELLADLGDVPLERFDIDLFTRWLCKRSTKKTKRDRVPRPGTLNNYVTLPKAAFNCVLKNGHKLECQNPLQYLSKYAPKNIQRRVIHMDEFKALYAALPIYLRPVFEYFYKVPSRRSEVLSLRNPVNLDLFNRTLTLIDDESKTDEGRVMPIPHSMDSYFNSIPKESEWVFFRPETLADGTIKYHPLRGQGILQAIQRAAKRTGVRDITVHTFRRTAAVNMTRAGVDLKTIMKAGGWKNVDTLIERYLPLTMEDVNRAMEKVDFVIEGVSYPVKHGHLMDTSGRPVKADAVTVNENSLTRAA